MLKTKKVTLLFNIYAKHACNSFTFVYSLYINNETNKEKKMTYETLQQAVGNKTKFEIVKTREFDFKGKTRKAITIKKLRSGNLFEVVKYENGTFSKAC